MLGQPAMVPSGSVEPAELKVTANGALPDSGVTDAAAVGPRLTMVETMVDARLSADENPFGRMVAFHGQMGMYVRALSYMMSHGGDGLRQVAEDAVLNANYILASLRDVMTAPFDNGPKAPCMHEALFDDSFLKDTGLDTLDFAKAMIDEGYHPMTMYFPLVVHGAMLIEPTETESKETLDEFIAAMIKLKENTSTLKIR